MARLYKAKEILDSAGRYVVEDELGCGGEGVTYLVTDKRTGQQIVAKVIDPGGIDQSEQLRDRLVERNQLQINHPCVIQSVGSGETVDNTPFVLFEYLDGYIKAGAMVKTLQHAQQWLSQTCLLLEQLASGLRAIHEKGYVHGDIKPANIMIQRLPLHGKWGDLGTAHKIGETRSPYAGSLPWKAPERFNKKQLADPRTDQAEFGYFMYFALTGQLPYQPDKLNESLKARRLRPVHEINPSIPRDLSDALSRATDDDIDKRFASMEPLREVLRRHLPVERQNGCERCQFAEGESFCVVCGAQKAVNGERLRCALCGNTLEGDASSCGHCGGQILSGTPRIAFDTGRLAGLTLVFPAGSYVAGRESIDPTYMAISRAHLRVEVKGDKVTVADAGAKRPMKINGMPIGSPEPLVLNTPISLAGCSGRVVG